MATDVKNYIMSLKELYPFITFEIFLNVLKPLHMLIIGDSRCKPGFFGEFCESECKCGNSLENVCDRTTGKCDLCKFGFGGHFCTGK